MDIMRGKHTLPYHCNDGEGKGNGRGMESARNPKRPLRCPYTGRWDGIDMKSALPPSGPNRGNVGARLADSGWARLIRPDRAGLEG